MFNVLIFIIGAGIMFYMGLRSVLQRRRLQQKGQRVEARVAGTVQSRDGTAYLLEFETEGGSHRLHYPKAAKGKGFASGEMVTLYYDPEDPEKMYVEGDRSVLGAEVLYFCLAVVLLCMQPAMADEGMWLPSLISERIDDMRAKGFRLTAEDIYSINKASMKDAVVLFNGGCTGELISPEGLLLTNHHCGYDAIQKHSTVEHDYLTNGFWAMSRAEELPNEKLWVRFLVRMEEVTDRIAAGETAAQIVEKAKAEGTGYKASVEQMYYGNQQFLFVYEQFDDVRLVAAPPSSIGKFGGDTDNWIWPRHTGDFSMFRVYASKDNRPAAYSPQNVPYRPKKHFSISTKGVKEGDFTMIYGFPGNMQEYILSDAVAYIAERSDPAKIAVRTGRLDIITKAQESDPALRIHYAAKQATIANAWKVRSELTDTG